MLWLATLATLLLPGAKMNLSELILNLSGLFGFVAWDQYIAWTWSIGNELVFYVFFPLFVLTTKRSVMSFWLIVAAIIGFFVYYSFCAIDEGELLRGQWKKLCESAESGLLVFGWLHHWLGNTKNQIPIMVEFRSYRMRFSVVRILSTFHQFSSKRCIKSKCNCSRLHAEENTVHLIAGWNRIVFSICCLMVCLGFYKLTIEFQKFYITRCHFWVKQAILFICFIRSSTHGCSGLQIITSCPKMCCSCFQSQPHLS